MFRKLFIIDFSSLFDQNRGVSIVRGGLTPSFSTSYYKKFHKLGKVVQNVTK